MKNCLLLKSITSIFNFLISIFSLTKMWTRHGLTQASSLSLVRLNEEVQADICWNIQALNGNIKEYVAPLLTIQIFESFYYRTFSDKQWEKSLICGISCKRLRLLWHWAIESIDWNSTFVKVSRRIWGTFYLQMLAWQSNKNKLVGSKSWRLMPEV